MQNHPQSYTDLVHAFEEKEVTSPLNKGIIYTINGISGKIAYNPTVPFSIFAPKLQKNITVLYARVESKDSYWLSGLNNKNGVYDPQSVLFYEKNPGVWEKADEAMFGISENALVIDKMEDPFITFINNEIILGGVVVDFSEGRSTKPIADDTEAFVDYTKVSPTVNTVFYRGKTLEDLQQVVVIKQMKDIRLVQLLDKSLFVAVRPQGGQSGIGSIGFVKINALEELTQEKIGQAIILNDVVTPDIKVGVNDLHTIQVSGENREMKEEVGVIAHTAYRDGENNFHYFACAFRVLNPNTFEKEGIQYSPLRIIAKRKNWEQGSAKRPRLVDVLFPSGIMRKNGQATLFTGLSDIGIGEITIPDPFITYVI